MATLVQSTCPGCKKLLHIPADWLSQPIRCKFCGLVMAMKQPAPPVRPSNSRTPLPASRPAAKAPPLPPAAKVPPPVPVVKAPPPVPPALKAPPPVPPAFKAPLPTLPPAPPPAASRKVTPPSIPLPRHATAPSLPALQLPQRGVAAPSPVGLPSYLPQNGDPFATLEGETGPVVIKPTRQRGSWWKGPLVFLVLAGVAAGISAFAWPHLRDRFNEKDSDKTVAQKKDDNNADVIIPPKEQEKAGYVDPFKDTPIQVVTSDPTKKPDPDPIKKPDPDPMKKPDPVKPPVDPMKKPDPDPIKKPDPVKPPVVAGLDFPRRALVISVHDYIFANPTAAAKIGTIEQALNTGLRIPLSQIYHLSDKSKDPHPPQRLAIEQTLTAFLDSSRPQDRILVFFIGHAVEIEGKGYLAPIAADLTNPAKMIELDWVLKRLEGCKARQKVLVLDGNRFSPTMGSERPGPGAMSEKMDALLSTPPVGVQIWQTCVKDQQSFETDKAPMGLFINCLTFALKPYVGNEQKPDQPFPLEKLNGLVLEEMKKDLDQLKLAQTPRINGKEAEEGAPFDPKEPAPPVPVAVAPPNEGGGKANQLVIRLVVGEIDTPPLKATNNNRFNSGLLPPFDQGVMDGYKSDDKPDSELRKAILKARAAMWVISTQQASMPAELKADADKIRAELKGIDLKQMTNIMHDGFKKPGNENQFKDMIAAREREIAAILGELMEVYDDLKAAKKMRDGETKRWQANYDFTVARLEAQIAYIFEFQSMLGQIRKEFPPKEEFHTGWVLASNEALTGDSAGKKLAASSRKILDQIAVDYAGTPWEVLARREKFTALGLEWKPTR